MHFLSYIICHACILWVLSFPHVCAHQDLRHSLEELNEHILEKPTPELLFQRAQTYRAMGNLNNAFKDLVSATAAKPNNLAWQVELCRLELASHHPEKALQIANFALKLAKDRLDRAETHILRAQAYQASGKDKPALHAYQLAFKESPAGKIDWFLMRSECQRLLGRHDEQIRGLRSGLKQFPDSIVKAQLVEALIDGKKNLEALKIINNELPTLRFKSVWLIKRARAKINQNDKTTGFEDLYTALMEINERFNPDKPDPLLLADKAKISLLMGDMTAARMHIEQLKKHNAPKWITHHLEQELTKK